LSMCQTLLYRMIWHLLQREAIGPMKFDQLRPMPDACRLLSIL
jgi:hypothetical protein